MTKQDLVLIRMWIEASHSALEWSVGGRTFQVCGLRGAEGLYERFLQDDPHPTRIRVSETDILEAFEQATTPFELYRGPKGSGRNFASEDELLQGAKSTLS